MNMKLLVYHLFINKAVNLDFVRSRPIIASLLEHRDDVYVRNGELHVRLRHGVFDGWQLLSISRDLTGDLDSFMVYTYDYELLLTVQLDDLLPIFFINS